MTNPSGESLRTAVERNAEAVMAGNLAQLMADVTPEALAQVIRAAPAGTPMTLAALPTITGYAIEERGPEGEGQIVHVTFTSAAGKATVAATWKQVLGQWKIGAVALVGVEPAPPAEPG
ncbi:MAG: hypothetical protein IT304_10635 [Dehalococcoidia bacterium]|nr:hypothetical protein [Dehalococcoidia bacterium]